MKITFIGAAHEVTGSCYYLEAAGKEIPGRLRNGTRTRLLRKSGNPCKSKRPGFCTSDSCTIMDHSGNPCTAILWHRDSRVPIYATDATCHLCDIMLRDSAHIQMFEAEWRNRKGRRQGKPEFVPAYTMEDAMGVLKSVCPMPL